MSAGSTGFADELERAVEPSRLIERALELVRIPSDPGDEAAVAAAYAAMLEDAGLSVTLEERYPGSPSVIARLPGATPGPVLQLAGHLDTVPVPQDDVGVHDDRLWGRGACDMKGGLAAIAEAASVIAGKGGPRRGSLLVTAYGQHEGSPADTMHEPLRDLLRRGIHGDMAVIGDGPHRTLPITGKGSIIFEVHLRRPGQPQHELRADPATPNPVLAAHDYVGLLRERARSWSLEDPDVGGESLFIGAIRGGDLYNRIAIEARIDGTRRYPAPRTYEEARAELEEVGRQVADAHGLEVEVIAHRSGQPFRLDRADPFIGTFQEAVAAVTGAPLPLTGSLVASDLNHVAEIARIPAVLHGTDPTRAHATPEWVPLAELKRAARVLARVTGATLDAGDPAAATNVGG